MLRRHWVVEKFDLVIYSLLIAFTGWYLLSLNYRDSNPIIIFQFLMIGIYSFWRTAACEKNISIYRGTFIFSYVFFFMAPIQQYTSGTAFWRDNGFSISFSDTDYILANVAILLFLALFDVCYFGCVKRIRNVERKDVEVDLHLSTMLILALMSFAAITVLLVTGNLNGSNAIVANSAVNSQLQHILRFIPAECFLATLICYFKKKKNGFAAKRYKFFIMLFLLESALIFYPFWGNVARFFLFGTYIVFLALFFANSQRKRSLVFFLFVIGFALIFTDSRQSTGLSSFELSAINFNHVDFDAYQMLMAMMRYVKEEGICFGKNILSALAFLLPRSIWTGKLESSGVIVTEYYGSWFNNVSMPLVGEAYFAFGWIGTVVFPIIFAAVAYKIDSWSKEDNFLRRCIFCLVTGMTIYIMRGALLAALSYLLGMVLAVIMIYLVCRVK